VQREFLLLEMMPTSALLRARLMISEVPRWYGREMVALCLGGAEVVTGMGGVWCGGWGVVVLARGGGGAGGRWR
jgi:hypothetical protein